MWNMISSRKQPPVRAGSSLLMDDDRCIAGRRSVQSHRPEEPLMGCSGVVRRTTPGPERRDAWRRSERSDPSTSHQITNSGCGHVLGLGYSPLRTASPVDEAYWFYRRCASQGPGHRASRAPVASTRRWDETDRWAADSDRARSESKVSGPSAAEGACASWPPRTASL